MDINVRFHLNKLNVVCNIKIACFAQRIQNMTLNNRISKEIKTLMSHNG